MSLRDDPPDSYKLISELHAEIAAKDAEIAEARVEISKRDTLFAATYKTLNDTRMKLRAAEEKIVALQKLSDNLGNGHGDYAPIAIRIDKILRPTAEEVCGILAEEKEAETKAIKLEKEDDFSTHLKKASKIVDGWPEWKRNVLRGKDHETY